MAREPAWNGRWDTAARLFAAFIGSLPPSVLTCVLLARAMPLPEPTAITVSALMVLPIWSVAIPATLLWRNGWRAWGACLSMTLLLGAIFAVVGPVPI